jgi:hypothetical protein
MTLYSKIALEAGTEISYQTMCKVEGTKLRRGMYYRLHKNMSVILMNTGPNAPYTDRITEEGRVLIYEGHDAPRRCDLDPKTIDQPEFTCSGRRTQNGLFHLAAQSFKAGKRPAELVKVYEKKRPGLWIYRGIYQLVDSRLEKSNNRKVFKFVLVKTGKKAQESALLLRLINRKNMGT